MAEGLLGGLLGGEEEAPEVEAGEGRVSAEAFAASLAADQAKHDAAVARAAEAFLQEQTRLLQTQREEITEQRTLRLSHLRSHSREGKLRRFGQRIRNGMQVFTALIFSAIGVAARKAPHYADPLKAWGDLLAREGQWKAALAKYDEALKYAPAWVELHQARDAAARRV